jgi:protein-S-isoprenylcysteine O-methyltransferase Ste14
MISLWMTIVTLFTTWGMWTIRRSFSITVEARTLVTAGPYRRIRHPVYLGEMMATLAVMVWRLSALNIMIFVLFVIIQLSRAYLEERKLLSAFPDYREFADGSWWFWKISNHAACSNNEVHL